MSALQAKDQSTRPRCEATISPLPWKVTDRHDHPKYMDAFVKIDNERVGIAYVFGEPKSEREANAAYIVKACNQFPEMLEALKQIEQMPWPNSESPYALIARAAIQKATNG